MGGLKSVACNERMNPEASVKLKDQAQKEKRSQIGSIGQIPHDPDW